MMALVRNSARGAAATAFAVALMALVQQQRVVALQLPLEMGPAEDQADGNSDEAEFGSDGFRVPILDAALNWISGDNDMDKEIHFVSINTDGKTALEKYGFPAEVENVGKGIKWAGYGTKLITLMYHAAKLPEDALMVYVDGNDVVWGGCSRTQFLRAYHSIVHASGAKVVVGAEMVCGEQSCDNSTQFPSWAVKHAETHHEALTRSRVTECKSQVKSDCRCDMPSQPECRNFEYTGIDDADWIAEEKATHKSAAFLAIQNQRAEDMSTSGGPLFRYLNSGFVMGPAKDVKDMLEWSVFHYLTIKDNRTWMHDQGAIAEYWRQNPDRVALDYRGELSLQLPRLAADVLELMEDDSGSKLVRNKLLDDRVQCFVHNNVNEWNGGPRADYWWDFFKKIKPDSKDWAA
eukprot:TRINITY_DN2087_c1_g1_i1.p1 TRINITY_DN2087_c1_g1~~TRINITY_DN2087_c1_g1_i1.p1  ORF type:complete len:405 (-),score=93.21 TRINITY_DN2087_c1_g1_i1:667-1881(-)